jgi:hypothetical protein
VPPGFEIVPPGSGIVPPYSPFRIISLSQLMIYIPAEVDAASLHDSRTIVTIQNSVLP